MASARQAQLQEQRRQSAVFNRFQGSRRTINYNSLGGIANGLSKRAQETELDAKIKLYNAGQLSNEDLLSFLNTMRNNPLVNPTEKAELDGKVQDLQVKIQTSQLEAAYKGAPDNSAAKIQAAKSLSDFYNAQAGRVVGGTPVHSNYLESAAQWNNVAISETSQMQKSARSLRRAQLFNDVSQVEPGTVDEAMAKAQAYMELANQAAADGDQQAALQFQTYANNEQNKIPAIEERLAKQGTASTKREIIDSINYYANLYHDGQITADQFASIIPQLEAQAIEIGDVSIQLSLNRWSDTLAKDAAKGVKRGTFNGLPVVLGKGKGGSGGGSGAAQTDWDVQDFNFSDNLKLAKDAFDAGVFDQKKYIDVLGKSIQERELQLEQRIGTIYELAKQNPNAKITYEGRKQRVADVLEQLTEESEKVATQAEAYSSGNFGIALVSPGEFTKGGDVKKSGKSRATFEIVDLRNLPKDQYIQDDEGVYHQMQRKIMKLSAQQAAEAAQTGGYLYDAEGNSVGRVEYDDAGNPFVRTNQKEVTLYDLNSGGKYTLDLKGDEPSIPSYRMYNETITKDVRGKELEAAKQSKMQELGMVKPQLEKPVEQPKPTGLVNTVSKVVSPQMGVNIAGGFQDAAKVIAPIIKKAIEIPLPGTPQYAEPAQVGITPQTKINLPPVAMPKQTGTGFQSSVVKPTTLKLAGTPQQNALQKQAQQPGFKPAQIQGPQGLPMPTKLNPNENIFTLAGKTVKNLASKIFPFKF